MMISWLQYWILRNKKTFVTYCSYGIISLRTIVCTSRAAYYADTLEVKVKSYLHGLVVNTEKGTLCLNSSVM